MRLRQVALVARDLELVIDQLRDVLGLEVAYRDPNVERFGLHNAVLPAGDGFLEVVAPFREDVSAARYLARRDGDSGYMVLLQTPDAHAERDRIAALGVRVVEDIDRPHYRAAHFHPSDVGGILMSVDEQRTAPDYLDDDGDWSPAGADWRGTRTTDVRAMSSVTIAAADPGALAARWSDLLGVPAVSRRLSLTRGSVEFEPAPDGAGSHVSAVGIVVADADSIADRASRAGVATDRGALIGGVEFRFES